MHNSTVTVFGGTGFLGRCIVRHLLDRKFSVRVASRHPERAQALFGMQSPTAQFIAADIHDETAIVNAIAGSSAVVNAVSLYAAHGKISFDSVHVDAARRLARLAHQHEVSRLVHVSGIGADRTSSSAYIRSRGEGEFNVRAEFRKAIMIRPAVMFGPGDGFLTTIVKLLRRLPAYPLFGRGETRLQPAYVEDVAEAIAIALLRADTNAKSFECAGPRIYAYKALLTKIADMAGVKVLLFPLPFAVWRVLARTAELLPNPPLTQGQVDLMEIDSTMNGGERGFTQLGISPKSIEEILPAMLQTRHVGPVKT